MNNKHTKKAIVLHAKQGGGKTTTSRAIAEKLNSIGIKTEFVKFADPLYEMHKIILNFMEDYGHKYEGIKHGPLLQYLGTEFGRKTYGANVWADIAKTKIERLPENTIAIVDDCRFKNEFLTFKDQLKIHLVADREIRKQRCENWRDNESHQSEIDLDDWHDKFDLTFETDKDKSPDKIAEEIVSFFLNS